MRAVEKKRVIKGFLKELAKEDIHLVTFKKFRDNSIWSKTNPQPSHRTMINVQFTVDRLNEKDIDREVDIYCDSSD